MFYASFGSYDLAIFDVYKDDRPIVMYIGHFYILLYLITNLLLLLNMVIAMMADTYANMTEVKKGLYNYQVLRIYPYYKPHKYWGLCVALTPPFHLLCMPFVWVPMMKKGPIPRTTTKALKLTNFFIYTIFSSAVFIAINLILLPFAYLKTVAVKVMLSIRGTIRVSEVLIFFFVGLPMLLVM